MMDTLLRPLARRQGLVEEDAKNCYLTGDDSAAGLVDQLLGSSVMYRIAIEA